MYYIISDADEILDTADTLPTQEDLLKAAKLFECGVWVLQGHHTGMSAEFNPKGETE